MHPYELAAEMRRRRYERSVPLNYGSLYSVVDSLQRRSLIAVEATDREGARPERTVYRLTTEGGAELHDWLEELVVAPVAEHPRFAAGLTFLFHVGRGRATELLERRIRALGDRAAADRALFDQLRRDGVPRLVLLEVEYALVLVDAELAWLRGLVPEIASGHLAWATPPTTEPEPTPEEDA